MSPPPIGEAVLVEDAPLPLPLGAAGPAGALAEAGVTSHLEALLARGRTRTLAAMLGPAFVASVAYVDPGNFATNIEGGSRFGYMLLWVVLLANLMAMLIQYLSAKLGIVTDHSLPELFRARYPKPLAWAMWVQAELMAMATDLAELLGAAIGLNLLFGMPLFTAGLASAAIAFAILALQRRGYRRFELAITALLGLIFVGFVYEALQIGPSASQSLSGLAPHLAGSSSLYLAMGIVGATVMPHVVYLHSALTKGRTPVRDEHERAHVLRFQRVDVIVALGLAGLVNMAMLAVAAKLFHHAPSLHVTTISGAHAALGNLVGGGAALAFAVALFASGASSSSVGTFAGQVVMSGFVGIQIPLLVRRLVTMAPAIIVLAAGLDATHVLVLSQVVLCFGIPFAVIPLVALTSRRDVMGPHVNTKLIATLAFAIAAMIVALNVLLVAKQLF